MNRTPRVLVVNAARRGYEVPRILDRQGMLEATFIDGCATKGLGKLFQLLPKFFRPQALQKFLDRRPGLPSQKVRSNAVIGIRYAIDRRRAKAYTETVRASAKYFTRFEKWVTHTDWGEANAVYVFDGASEELLTKAKSRGMFFVHEQTIAPGELMQHLVEEESKRHPGWERIESIPDELIEFGKASYWRSWKAADVIFCGSEYVKDSIDHVGGPVEKCVVLPYGVNVADRSLDRPQRSGKLRVVTVGTVNLRKGAPYVLEAAKRVRHLAEFRMVGPVQVSDTAVQQLRECVEVVGPVRASEVEQHLAWADVYLLPSVCEGSAVSVYEAMATGLPVIVTPNSGSVARDGVDGFVIPAGNADAVVDRLEQLQANPLRRLEMGRNARARAQEFTSEVYANRLVEILKGRTPLNTSVTTATGATA